MNMNRAKRSGGPLWGRGTALIVISGLLLAGVAVAFAVTNNGAEYRVASGLTNGATIAIFVCVGLFAWRRDPDNRFGWLLMLAGFGWFFVSLATTDSAVLYSVGRTAAWIEEVLLVYLYLSYPASRPETAPARAVVGAAVGTLVLLYLPTVFLVGQFPMPSPYAVCSGVCPHNALQITSTQPAFVDDVVRPVRELITVAVFFATAAVIAVRLRRSTSVMRRTLVPVLLAALLSAGMVAVYIAARRGGASDQTLEVLEQLRGVTTPVVGIGFLVSLVLWQLYEARALERMALSPSDGAPPAQLQELLADALQDDSLELRFETDGEWRDAFGSPARPPDLARDRCVVEVGSAAIVCDPGFRAHRRLIRAAATWVEMSNERERLTRLLGDSLHEVAASRHRLATATASERRRIERDLHDGAQQRLVTLRVQIALVDEELKRDPVEGARRLRELGPSVDAVIDDVRSLASGIYPPLLADAGLVEALRAVASRAVMPVTIEADRPQRYPLEIESAAYFCCLEALQNAAKHSGAPSVTIAISSDAELLRFTVRDAGRGFRRNGSNGGSGLTNMRDRLAAVGGRIEIEASPGAGTCVTGEVPVDGDR